jgi:hypothetical protein
LVQVAIFLRNEKVQRGYKDAESDPKPLAAEPPPLEAGEAPHCINDGIVGTSIVRLVLTCSSPLSLLP